MSKSPTARFYRELLDELRERSVEIEWELRTVNLRGKKTKVIEAYCHETNEGVGIAIDEREKDREKLIDTILANAEVVLPSDLLREVILEEMDREDV